MRSACVTRGSGSLVSIRYSIFWVGRGIESPTRSGENYYIFDRVAESNTIRFAATIRLELEINGRALALEVRIARTDVHADEMPRRIFAAARIGRERRLTANSK